MQLFDHFVGARKQRCWNSRPRAFATMRLMRDAEFDLAVSTGISVPRASPQAPLMALAR